MHKIEMELREAILNRKVFSKQNTVFTKIMFGSEPKADVWGLFLHGHIIAMFNHGSNVPEIITLAGYPTKTIRSRLNALDGVDVRMKNFIPYLNGRKIDAFGWFSPKE